MSRDAACMRRLKKSNEIGGVAFHSVMAYMRIRKKIYRDEQ